MKYAEDIKIVSVLNDDYRGYNGSLIVILNIGQANKVE